MVEAETRALFPQGEMFEGERADYTDYNESEVAKIYFRVHVIYVFNGRSFWMFNKDEHPHIPFFFFYFVSDDKL